MKREMAAQAKGQSPRTPRRPLGWWGAATLPLGWWAAAALTLAALLLLGAFSWGPPTVQVLLNGTPAASGQDPAALQAHLLIEMARRAGQIVQLQSEEESWEFSLADLGMGWPKDAAIAGLQAALAQLSATERLPWRRPVVPLAIEPTWDLSLLAQTVAPIREAIKREPEPAVFRVADRMPLIAVEQEGFELDLPALGAAVAAAVADGRSVVSVPVRATEPAVTAASLSALGIRRLIAEWTTEYDPSIPRAENVEKAARSFDGLMLGPGEILSYNAVVGPISTETGWKQSIVIVGGELVPGVGGGACQVSTTLYGAALRANLEIMERHPHQLAVPYIAPSQDAAIAQGWEDLKLRNTSLGHLYIETESGGGRVTFRLYGSVPEGQTVSIESRQLGYRPFETRTVVDPSLAPGQQEIKIWGIPGLISEAYRLVYQDGALVSRERLSRDQYLATTQVVVVGPAAD